jgi:hypothetical protein
LKAQKNKLIQLSKKNQNRPDPEVLKKRPRRKLTAKYKLRVFQEVVNCTAPSKVGALLRCEVLYSSNLTAWRKQKEQRVLHCMTLKIRQVENKNSDSRTKKKNYYQNKHQLKRNTTKELKIAFLTSTMVCIIALIIAAIYKFSSNAEEYGNDQSFADYQEQK